MKKYQLLTIAAGVSISVGVMAATTIAPTSMTNPAPTEAFQTYDHFEAKPISMEAPFAGQKANEAAVKKIQENLDLRLNPMLDGWNNSAVKHMHARTLLIEPHVESIKFIGGGARFFVGAMAGNSGVLIKVKFTDASTGQVIAEPQFYQHANAVGGAYSFGGTDNAMLAREGNLIADYIQANYSQTVGGKTGVEDAKDLKK